MDKLRAEIAKKRSLAEALRQKSAVEETAGMEAVAVNTETKFIRQRDIEILREKELEEEQRRLDESREERRRQQLREEEEKKARAATAAATTSNSSSLGKKGTATAPAVAGASTNLREKYMYILQLTVGEVKAQLRSYRQPATIFGEQPNDRAERLLALCIDEEVHGHPQQRDHAGYQKMLERRGEAEERAFDAADEVQRRHDHETTPSSDSDASSDDEDGDAHDGDEQRASKKARLDDGGATVSKKSKREKVPGVFFDPKIMYHKQTDLSPEKIIYKFFRSLVKQWEWDLQMRPDHEKGTAKGREETKAHKKCKDYIRPLFRLCQKKEVPEDILHRVGLMVQACEEGNFVKANDEYMRTAIGNSAWPMGLTMVGIHERSGRERISTSKVMPAHQLTNCHFFFAWV